jgi:hypothetical protein
VLRSVSELVAATAASVMAVLVLASGAAIEPSTAPPSLAAQASESPGDHERTCLDAPVTAHSASNVAGEAQLCPVGRGLIATARIDGLRAGAVYTAWLSYVDRPALCRDVPCGPIDLFGDNPVGLLERVDGGVVPPSGTLELTGELHDLEISSGAQVTLLLMRPRNQAYAHAEAVFFVP